MLKKGISLIVLVITIIIMIVLVSIIIINLSSNKITTQAEEAVFKSDMKAALMEVDNYVASQIVSGLDKNNKYSKPIVNSGNGEGQLSIKEIIPGIKDKYVAKLQVIDNKLYYLVNFKDKSDKQKGMWACQSGLIVEGFSNCQDILDATGIDRRPIGKCDDNTGICQPDLTGFNANITYYLMYDENGKEILGETISNKPPQDWYDYSEGSKKWANIKIINGDNQAYYVWIPRYEYKIIGGEDSTTPKEVLTNYITTTQELTEGYKLPAAFTWDMTDVGGEVKQLPGFWYSKYEVTNDSATGVFDFTYKAEKNSINITGIQNTTVAITYEYWINGEKKSTSTATTYEYMGLERNKEYEVTVKVVTGNGDVIRSVTKKISTIAIPTEYEANKPNLTGFNVNTTYYVTYDSNGNPVKGDKISEVAPGNWYNYGGTKDTNKWANIVAVDDKGTEDTSDDTEAYFVWIPRYEYYIYGGNTASTPKEVEVVFIPTTKITPTYGYEIPAAFVWDMTDTGGEKKQLEGFWASKYEVSQSE